MKTHYKIKLGLCQFDVEFGKTEKNLKKAEKLIKKCDADIIVLPELFTSGYLFTSKEEVKNLAEKRDGKTIRFLKDMAKEKGCFIFAGFAEKSNEGIYNSSALIGYDESEIYYRKTHLFYEEKLYFQKSSNPLKSRESRTYDML
jgi:predicted amidohydrolase